MAQKLTFSKRFVAFGKYYIFKDQIDSHNIQQKDQRIDVFFTTSRQIFDEISVNLLRIIRVHQNGNSTSPVALAFPFASSNAQKHDGKRSK